MSWSRRRWMIIAAVSVPTLAAAVLTHTASGRALLGLDGCPWGGAPPSAAKLEDSRVKSAASLKANANVRAAARPAFGFVLDKSTRAELITWGKSVGAVCREELGGSALRCEADDQSGARTIAADGGVPIRDAFFRFDPRGVLVGVDLMRDGTDGEKAASVLATLSERIAREAGPPTTVQGKASPTHLSAYLSRAATEFRFADYAADVSATNFGAQGVVVREQYRSIPN